MAPPAAPRERILQAALALLEAGGAEAVTSRAVSAAAAVQPPTLYRHFGDMLGLMDEVASRGFSTYLQAKLGRDRHADPVDDLRTGWDEHIQFGLAHPHLYVLMFGAPRPGTASAAALASAAVLRGKVQRVAEAGRLGVSVERGAALFSASALGVTLSLLGAGTPDDGLSAVAREATLRAILVPGPAATGDPPPDPPTRAAAHAVALVSVLPQLSAPLSPAERAMLTEWLGRLM